MDSADANDQLIRYAQCDINETLIHETADLMIKLGLKDVGYNYLNLDDCYSERNRSASGDIIASEYIITVPPLSQNH
jgi:hypothetical protein